MTDGLGRRIAATDPATGEPVEHLELATELVLHTAFATALAERVTRLSAVRHASYVQVRRVDRPEIDRLVVVSSAIPGRRLSDLLDASAAAASRPDIEAVVSPLRQLLPAAALFSNFEVLAKQVTQLHYEDDLGIPLGLAKLSPVELPKPAETA